jgi:GTP cyclohydrolase I
MTLKQQHDSLFREAKQSATRDGHKHVGACISFAPAQTAIQHDIETEAQSLIAAETLPARKAPDMEKMALGVKLILEAVGEDVDRPGLADTPSRVARMYRELLYGIGVNPASEVTCEFQEGSDDPVIVKDIPFATVCEHHLVPFVGKADVAYIPKEGRITGLSKIARVVESAARRLQVQERMTAQIADAIAEALEPHGVLVVLNAEHMCMSIRGIKKPGSMTTTMSARGVLKEDRAARLEILQLIEH